MRLMWCYEHNALLPDRFYISTGSEKNGENRRPDLGLFLDARNGWTDKLDPKLLTLLVCPATYKRFNSTSPVLRQACIYTFLLPSLCPLNHKCNEYRYINDSVSKFRDNVYRDTGDTPFRFREERCTCTRGGSKYAWVPQPSDFGYKVTNPCKWQVCPDETVHSLNYMYMWSSPKVSCLQKLSFHKKHSQIQIQIQPWALSFRPGILHGSSWPLSLLISFEGWKETRAGSQVDGRGNHPLIGGDHVEELLEPGMNGGLTWSFLS